ncbi:MAG: hypothetical protein FOGNACKC_03299 [Anaerolineae bacterium]|nr:hypothetical protein [Anaerolineae bacterium]
MRYQITIRRAGTVLNNVVVEARSVLEAIELLDAGHEKFIVQLSHGHDELISVLWSGFEYEARQLDPVTPPRNGPR